MSFSRLSVFFLAALVAVGCDSSDPEPTPQPQPIRINGSYAGTTNFEGTAVSIVSTLTENSNIVNGSGTLRIVQSAAITATGSHVAPDFNITFRATGLEDLNYAGTTNADASILRGTLNGSGFQNINLQLVRGGTTFGPGGTASADAAPVEIPEGITTFRELFELQAQQR